MAGISIAAVLGAIFLAICLFVISRRIREASSPKAEHYDLNGEHTNGIHLFLSVLEIDSLSLLRVRKHMKSPVI